MKFVWVIMIAGLLAGSAWFVVFAQSKTASQENAEARTRSALASIQREIRVRSGSEGAELNGRGWPVTMDPAWFDGQPPANALLKGSRPWVEVASWDERDLEHPLVRQAVDRNIAAFWYNPGNGIVRARTGVMVSDKAAIEAYNRVNNASIDAIVETIALDKLP